MPRPDYESIAWQWMESAMAEVTSADRAYDWFRVHEMYVPRSVVREVWREVGDQTYYRDLFNRLPENYFIPRRWTVDREIRFPEKYYYRLEISGINDETFKPYTRGALLKSDAPLRIADVRSYGNSLLQAYGFETVIDEPKVAIKYAWHKAGASW